MAENELPQMPDMPVLDPQDDDEQAATSRQIRLTMLRMEQLINFVAETTQFMAAPPRVAAVAQVVAPLITTAVTTAVTTSATETLPELVEPMPRPSYKPPAEIPDMRLHRIRAESSKMYRSHEAARTAFN